MARIPSTKTSYPLLGRCQDWIPATWSTPKFLGYQYDASTTTFSYILPATNSSIHVDLIFSSPVTPDSTLHQSLPASYLEIKVSGSEDVEIYVENNGMWVTNDYYHKKIIWEFSHTDTLQTWSVRKAEEQLFTEDRDRAEWGTFYFSAPRDEEITFQSAPARQLRTRFATRGYLSNKFDTRYREVMNEEPLFAFAKHYKLAGHNKTRTASTLYTVALVHDPIIQYTSARGLTLMKPLWLSYFDTTSSMLDFHFLSYANVSTTAAEFSKKIQRDGENTVSPHYSDLLSLSARQTIGACYFTGTPSAPILFMKEISSDGNMNTVDVIFPASPFFLYSSPSWLSYLLEPLLEHQNAGLYPRMSSMHDLGASFPNATGHPDGNDEPMPVEECGNMLIMGLAYANTLTPKAAKEWILFEGRYSLWKQWTQYLVDFSLFPAHQLSTDDFAGRLANQTNLAIKGLIGIKAMARLSYHAGEREDAEKYESIAEKYLPIFLEHAVDRSGTHTKLAYHWQGSWGSLYNAYADALLCLHLGGDNSSSSFYTSPSKHYIPPELYRLQSAHYSNVLQTFGLPLDSRHLYTKSDWEIWTAAISSKEVRKEIIHTVTSWLNETTINRPLTDIYDTEGRGWCGIYFMNRPVVGGHFAIAALDGVCGGKGLEGVEKVWHDEKGKISGEGSGQKVLVGGEQRERDVAWGREVWKRRGGDMEYGITGKSGGAGTEREARERQREGGEL